MKVTALDIHRKIVRLTALRDACRLLLELNDTDRRFDEGTMFAIGNAGGCLDEEILMAEDELKEAWKEARCTHAWEPMPGAERCTKCGTICS